MRGFLFVLMAVVALLACAPESAQACAAGRLSRAVARSATAPLRLVRSLRKNRPPGGTVMPSCSMAGGTCGR